MKIFLLVVLSILIIVPVSMAGTNHLSFETFFSVDRLGTPVVSPDGQQVAFTIKKADNPANTYSTQIWIMDPSGNNQRQLTTHTASSSSPVFSPDSKFVFFLSSRSGSSQVWKIQLSGGEAIQITDLYDGVEGFCLSPDGKQLLLQRSVPPDCPDEDAIREKGEAAKNNPVKARVIDRLMYRHWNSWLEGKYTHLFLYTIETQSIKDLTPGPIHTPPIALGGSQDYAFSPDGKEIVFVSNHEKQIAISTNNDIFLLNLEKGAARQISSSPGNDNSPVYSPDGKYIAYSSMERPGFEADRQRLFLYNRSSGKTIELTTDFTLSIGEILWQPDSKSLCFTAEESGNISIYRVPVDGGEIKSVLQGHYVRGVQFLDKNTLIFSKQSTQMPFELFSFNLKSAEVKPLTRFNQATLAAFDLPPYEEFWFTGANGDRVQGFIMRPPNYEKGKKYPAVHMIHGGPQGMWSNDWHFRWNYQMFAAPGYAVYFINFHGSRGYGQKFTDSISEHWGDLPYEDLVKGTDYVLKNFDFVDGNRLAAAGASYGGFMVNWIAGHENPYKCLISHDGVYDQKSMWGSTEELWFPEWEMGGLPWEENTTYEKWSPSRLAANFKTPTLVIHGEHDYRVPYTQGLQFFSALQRQGVPSRLLFFPDEDHFVQKPQNAQLWWKTMYGWMATYLK